MLIPNTLSVQHNRQANLCGLHGMSLQLPRQCYHGQSQSRRGGSISALPFDASMILDSQSSALVLAAAAPPVDGVPSFDDAVTFLLQHPLYILAGGALTLAVVPKVLEVCLV